MSSNSKIEWCDASWHEKTAAKRIGVDPREYIARIAIGEKWCTSCKQWHSRFIFPKDSTRGDGLSASCLGGHKPARKKLSPEEKRARANAGYRKYYASSGGERIRAAKYARKRGIEPIDPRTRELVMESSNGKCVYCGAKATSIDHVIPVAHGGSSRRGNLLPACGSCNSRKKTMSLQEFLSLAKCPDMGAIVNELIMEDIL